jgi:hypothetical protein
MEYRKFYLVRLHGYFYKIVIPAWIHVRLSCLTPFGLMQIRSRRICAGIQSPWMDLNLPSMALDTRFPAGMTGLRINLTELIILQANCHHIAFCIM